jgi:hypothetical protein
MAPFAGVAPVSGGSRAQSDDRRDVHRRSRYPRSLVMEEGRRRAPCPCADSRPNERESWRACRQDSIDSIRATARIDRLRALARGGVTSTCVPRRVPLATARLGCPLSGGVFPAIEDRADPGEANEDVIAGEQRGQRCRQNDQRLQAGGQLVSAAAIWNTRSTGMWTR